MGTHKISNNKKLKHAKNSLSGKGKKVNKTDGKEKQPESLFSSNVVK